MKFVKNGWYAAAWAEEITRELFQRTLLNESVLLYRSEAGSVIAMSNLCPHRFAPMHLGKLIGDDVECPYHGLRFDCTGKCVDNPHGDGAIPRAAVLKKYPIEERYGVVWIWMGDPEKADPTLIADYSCMTNTKKFTTAHGYLNLKANYQLVMDNLTDLSHASFVHEATLEPRETAKNKFNVKEEGNTVFTWQWCPNNPITPLFKKVLGRDGLMDHWLEMRYVAPSCMLTYYGVTECGASRDEGWATENPNIITPETENSTHYFWATSRNYDLDNEDVTEMWRQGAIHAFTYEDKPMLEAQQEFMGAGDLMDRNPVLLVNDAGSVRCRRMLKRMLEAEANEKTDPKKINVSAQ